jgi:hypothetical protein
LFKDRAQRELQHKTSEAAEPARRQATLSIGAPVPAMVTV